MILSHMLFMQLIIFLSPTAPGFAPLHQYDQSKEDQERQHTVRHLAGYHIGEVAEALPTHQTVL